MDFDKSTEDVRGEGRPEREIGRYTLLRELGRGAQGSVYLARDNVLRRKVALKILGRTNERDRFRFENEAAMASRLDHHGIATVMDFGEHEGEMYIAMRYVEGDTLAARIWADRDTGLASTEEISFSEDGTPDQEIEEREHLQSSGPSDRNAVVRAVRIVEDCAHALHHAHQAGLVHRDIKPGNIMVTPDDEPVICDFGLARDDLSGDISLTQTGDLVGTPAYMSPEQLTRKAVRVDARSDIYSLGVVLYELLTLQRPFREATREALYQAILVKEPIRPRKLNSHLPRDLEIVVLTAMEKDRDRRYATAEEFADDLRRIREYKPIKARPIGPILRLARYARRRPALAAVWMLVPVAVVFGAVALLQTLGRDADRERHTAAMETYALRARVADLSVMPADRERLRAWLDMHDSVLSREPSGDGVDENLAWLEERRPLVARMAELAERVAETASRDEPGWTRVRREVLAAGMMSDSRPFELKRVPGLTPWRRNPRSGLQEFWHVATGVAPTARADGTCVIAPETAIVFVLVPGGSFRMGSPADGKDRARDDNEDELDVRLAPFFIAAHEVTKGQWTRLMGSDPGGYTVGQPFADNAITPAHPVENVSHADAAAFMRRIGARLPTEAQWEYAARAGTRKPHVHVESWQDLDDFENVERGRDYDDGLEPHTRVGRFEPNPWGLFDMLGNVSEWCRDEYVRHRKVALWPDGATEYAGDRRRFVVRGASWATRPEQARVSWRQVTPAETRSLGLGVRPVIETR